MRRLKGVGLAAMLAGASLVPACVLGGSLHPGASPFSPAIPDFASAFAMRFFGEIDDARATSDAVFGDRISESPLRESVFRVSFAARRSYPAMRVSPYAIATVDEPLPQPTLLAGEALRVPALSVPHAYETGSESFAAPSSDSFSPAPETASLRPFQPYGLPSYVPASSPNTFSLQAGNVTGGSGIMTFTPQLTPANAFDAGADEPGAQAAFSGAQQNVSLPLAVDVGSVHVRGHLEGAQSQPAALSLQTQAMAAGADVNFHALRRDVQLNVGGAYEHLQRNDAVPFASSQFDETATLQLAPNGLVPIPTYADLSKRTVSAGVAVPITRNLTVGAQYDQQHLLGGYGAQGVNNVDARNDIYGGNVTFNLPHNPAASISLSAKQYRFQDNIIPSNAFTQTRADLNFTVKFH